jgi:hypothetical protein
MTIQRSVTSRDAENNAYSSTLGTTGVTYTLFTGPPPATCAAADTGTVIVVLALPSSPLAASSGGTISKSAGAWTGPATGAGSNIAGHYRMKASGGAVVEQGTVAMQSAVNTSASTPANGNVLTFASAPGVAVGQTVSGTGVLPGTTVAAVVGATVVMSKTSTAGVASAAAITFGADVTLDNTNIAFGQTVTIASYAITAGDV